MAQLSCSGRRWNWKDSSEMPKERSWFQITFSRLSRNRLAMVSLVILIFLVLCAVLAPIIAPYDRFEMDFSVRLTGPTASHWFGTDESGRDLLSRILWGARISLGIAFIAVLIGMIIGIPWGMIAAYRGGAIDDVLMRICAR
jgi:ABC-type dipeptide/oligopeptide/nickel transport system permease subunit